MAEEPRPAQAECPSCGENLVLLPSYVFKDEDAAAAVRFNLGVITDTETEKIVAHYALLEADGHYVCPVCKERHGGTAP
jgi:hypothetical protein